MGFEASTMAIGVVIEDSNSNRTQAYANTLVRVQFSYLNYIDRSVSFIDAAYCEDLYADQIAAEKTGAVSTNDYTRVFTNDLILWNAEFKWICPNITQAFLHYDPSAYVRASISKCNGDEDDYAKGEECASTEDSFDYLNIYLRSVSSYFDPQQYFEDGTLQLYYQDHT